MLPGTGRSGCDFSDLDWRSKYTLRGPTPFVLVIDFEIGLNLGGKRIIFRGGRAGFEIAFEKPIASGTAKPPKTQTALKSDTWWTLGEE